MRTVAEVKRHLTNFVKNELFHGEEPPNESRRRYYPTDTDIRNVLNSSRIGSRKAPDDQSNLEAICMDWNDSHPGDFIFFRVRIYFYICCFVLGESKKTIPV